MTAEQHSRPSEEEILLAFSVEPTHDRKTLEQYLIEYPEHAKALVTCSIELMFDVTRNDDVVVTSEGAIDRAWQRFQTSTDLSDYLVLLPADAVRHVDGEHGGDSRTQRAPAPEDYADAGRWLRDGEVELSDPGPDGKTRIKSNYRSGGEDIQSIWEVRPGKKNRALALVSMWVKR